MNLVLHVCKEAPGVESVFLMSKTNCAFANFKDEEACAAAQAKLHDSRFQNVGLTSRLRRNSVGASASVTAPADPMSDPIASSDSASPSKEADEESADVEREESSSAKDKFFVVKSHTVEDLELSIRNGIWATQSHNEAAFNKAFQACSMGFKYLGQANFFYRLLITSTSFSRRINPASFLATQEWHPRSMMNLEQQ